jgi:hypothetical protein
MSTPECLRAVNETIPPLPRPQYKEFRSLHHLIARRLVPFINASYALEQEMLGSNSYCGAKDASNLFTPSIDCLQLEVSEQLQKRSNIPNAWPALAGFPLPSTENVRYLNNLSARFPVATSTYVIELGVALIWALFWLFVTRRWRYSSNCRWYFTMHWRFYWSISFIRFWILLATYSWSLVQTLSKDIFIKTCLSTQVQCSLLCSQVLERQI